MLFYGGLSAKYFCAVCGKHQNQVDNNKMGWLYLNEIFEYDFDYKGTNKIISNWKNSVGIWNLKTWRSP